MRRASGGQCPRPRPPRRGSSRRVPPRPYSRGDPMTPEPELDAPPAPGADAAGESPEEVPTQAAPDGPRPPAITVAPVVVPRWVQLVLLPLAVLALYVVAKAAGVVLLVFLVAAVIALVLNPLVRLVE